MKKKIIGLMAEAHSGKDTAGSILQAAVPKTTTLAFATKFKTIVKELFGLTDEQLYGPEKDKPTNYKCNICPSCGSVDITELSLDGRAHAQCNVCRVIGDVTVFKKYWTPRMIYQFVGTDCFRRIWNDVWVNYTMNQADESLDLGANLVIVTDVRYLNEAEAIWARGGEVWRIKRNDREPAKGLPNHSSEAEQLTIPDAKLQAVIDNNGSEEHLKAQILVQLNRMLAG